MTNNLFSFYFHVICYKLGFKLVYLIDYDGDVTLSFKRKHPFGGFYAYRLWLIGSRVSLNNDYTCSGINYVKYWKDYPYVNRV